MTTLEWVVVIACGMSLFTLVGLMLAAVGVPLQGSAVALGVVRASSGASGSQGWRWPLTYLQCRFVRSLAA